MIKVLSFVLIVFISLALPLWATPADFFTSLATNEKVLPTDAELGLLSSYDSNPALRFLQNSFAKPYDIEWTETFITAEQRKNLVAVFNEDLAKVLPSAEHLFSVPLENSDGSTSISVRFLPINLILTFVITPEPFSICAMK